MKLKVFDPETMPQQARGESTITLRRKGASGISKAAMQKMGFESGDKIAIYQDEEHPEDWYISLAEVGFELRVNESGGAVFNASSTANHILDEASVQGDAAGFLIAGKPTIEENVNYWGILIGRPIVKKRKSQL